MVLGGCLFRDHAQFGCEQTKLGLMVVLPWVLFMGTARDAGLMLRKEGACILGVGRGEEADIKEHFSVQPMWRGRRRSHLQEVWMGSLQMVWGWVIQG
jgi:hypothetical protein